MSTTATALCDGWLMNRYCLRPTSRSAITRESFPASVMCPTTSAESPLLPFAPIAAGPNSRSASNEAAALFLHRSFNCDFMSASFDLNYGPWLRTLNYGPWLRTLMTGEWQLLFRPMIGSLLLFSTMVGPTESTCAQILSTNIGHPPLLRGPRRYGRHTGRHRADSYIDLWAGSVVAADIERDTDGNGDVSEEKYCTSFSTLSSKMRKLSGSNSVVQRGRPIRRTRSSKRGFERRGSKPGRSRTPGLNRSS